MTPARIAALEVCAEVLADYVAIEKFRLHLTMSPDISARLDALEKRCVYDYPLDRIREEAIAAVERLEEVEK